MMYFGDAPSSRIETVVRLTRLLNGVASCVGWALAVGGGVAGAHAARIVMAKPKTVQVIFKKVFIASSCFTLTMTRLFEFQQYRCVRVLFRFADFHVFKPHNHRKIFIRCDSDPNLAGAKFEARHIHATEDGFIY